METGDLGPEQRAVTQDRPGTELPPFVSIVMPVRNEGRSIERTLRAVLGQDYPAELMEVLVVDGLSTDATREKVSAVAEHARATGGPRVSLLDNPTGLTPCALNIGIDSMVGDVLVRVDGHCELAPDYVRRCVDALERTRADNVGGVQHARGYGWVGRAVALATCSRFGIGNSRFHYAQVEGPAESVYLGAYRRDVFDRIGKFDCDLVRVEDWEFNARLRQSGGRIWLDPAIRSVYEPRNSLRRLFAQYFRFGFKKPLVMLKRRERPRWRHLVPSAFVLGAMGSIVGGLFLRAPYLMLLVVAPYAVASVCASCASLVASRRDPIAFPMLPLVFATMHFAYGLGFFLGAIRWARWRPSARPSWVSHADSHRSC